MHCTFANIYICTRDMHTWYANTHTVINNLLSKLDLIGYDQNRTNFMLVLLYPFISL